MNHREVVEKVIGKFMSKEFPEVIKVIVISYYDNGKNYDTVALAVKYADFNDDIKERARALHRTIFPHDNLQNVIFVGPDII